MARPPLVELTITETVERLHAYSRRLVRSALRTLVLYEAWAGLNVESEARRVLAGSPVTMSVGVMWEATQDTLILSITRVLDELSARARAVDEDDKVSFPVFGALLDKQGVIEMLVRDGRSHVNDEGRKTDVESRVRDSATGISGIIDLLRTEEPNRVARLRDIRNRHLAHNLNLQNPLAPPIYDNFRTTTDVILQLAEHANAVVHPTNLIEWPRGEVLGQTGTLVGVISERFR